MKGSEMELNDLVKMCIPLFDKANKRIKRLEDSGLHSPALEEVLKGGTFSIKGKDLDTLKREYNRVRAFLSMETSTVTGAKNYERRSRDFSDMNPIEIRTYLESKEET